jgi:uncharacterized protein (DUF2344 family)
MSKAKSYWLECHVSAENQATIQSWFGGMADGMKITKAEILCAFENDREKKIRVFARKDERDYVLTRTKGATLTVSCKDVTK